MRGFPFCEDCRSLLPEGILRGMEDVKLRGAAYERAQEIIYEKRKGDL